MLNCFRHEDRVECRTEAGVTYIPVGTRERLALVLEVYDPVWATAWRGSAHAHHREALGLSETPWPYIDWLDMKLPSIVRYAKERPWAFVDDDVQWELGKLHPAFAVMPNTLILDPDPRVGLTDAHVVNLLDFAESLGSIST